MGDVIKQFLVGLGFGVDDTSLAKFNKAVSSATAKVGVLYASVTAAAGGIFYSISKISEGFEQMGYEYRLIAPAINKALILRQELLKAYRTAGVNIQKVIQDSVRFNFTLARTQFAFKAIYASVATKFLPLLTKQMEVFRKQIYANMPKIQAQLSKFITFVFKAFEAIYQLGNRLWSILSRVYDFFSALHEATNGWSTAILAVIAAWNLLDLAFIATPLGFIITGLVAILALFDDFKTWQEGGKSLFDWSPFVPIINSVGDALIGIVHIIDDLVKASAYLAVGFVKLFTGDWSGAMNSWAISGERLVSIFGHLLDTLVGVGNALINVGKWALSAGNWDITKKLFGDGSNISANAQSLGGQGAPIGSPLVSSPSNVNHTNYDVNQQTSINVMASPDANNTAKSVASEQNRVNFDFTRNLTNPTR